MRDFPRERLTVQELVRGHWHTVRSAIGDRVGSARFVLRVGPGRHTYRLSVGTTLLHAAATTRPVVVRVPVAVTP